jgi:hypothetical protein
MRTVSIERESIAERLREVLSRLAAMEKNSDWQLSEWASLFQEKLELERKLNLAIEEGRSKAAKRLDHLHPGPRSMKKPPTGN